jgi:hypothetical protein
MLCCKEEVLHSLRVIEAQNEGRHAQDGVVLFMGEDGTFDLLYVGLFGGVRRMFQAQGRRASGRGVFTSDCLKTGRLMKK